jgi:TetR/AcrR family transcriptional regulator, transcriptional repressor for nem operon
MTNYLISSKERNMRPKTFDTSETLEKALIIFWTKGYQGASMQDLLEGMEIGRASMYHSFGSKEELFLMVIDHYTQTRCQTWLKVLEKENGSLKGIGKLLRIIVKHATGDEKPKGCLVASCLSEEFPFGPDVQSKLTGAQDYFIYKVQEYIKEGIKKGELTNIGNAKDLTTYLMTVILGIMYQSRVHETPVNYNGIIKFTLSFFSP